MDFATWVGLVLALVVFIVQTPWVAATLGILSIFCLTFSWGQLTQGLKASLAVFQAPSLSTKSLIDEMVKTAALARKEGVLVLEAHRASIKNPQFKKAIKWVSDGYELETLKEMLSAEMARELSEYAEAISFSEKASQALKGVSVVTLLMTIIESARLMQVSDQFAAVLASGFLAAMVPLGLSVFLFSPISEKLKSRKNQEKMPFQLVSMGVIAILEGMSPAFLEEKLKLRASFTFET